MLSMGVKVRKRSALPFVCMRNSEKQVGFHLETKQHLTNTRAFLRTNNTISSQQQTSGNTRSKVTANDSLSLQL